MQVIDVQWSVQQLLALHRAKTDSSNIAGMIYNVSWLIAACVLMTGMQAQTGTHTHTNTH